MREITQLLMHDSAVQLFAFGYGWSEFHSEKFQLDYDTRKWASKLPYTNGLPDEPAIERGYMCADGGGDIEIVAYGEITAPSMLDMELHYKNKSGEEWTESITYCGTFTVWWAKEQA